MKRWPRLILPLLLAGLLSACASKPSEQELQTLLAQTLCAEGPQSFCKVENLHKQNGYWKDGHYVAEVRYELVFTKGLRDVAIEAERQPGGPLDKLTQGLGLMTLGLLYGDFKAGDRLPREQAVTLLKTEQGWRIDKEKGATP
ncbi:hypothetical protein [Thiofaba sp. EF100]|jgi:hypothetical protein|uniref:hypothetical protein n=1 Tax=Thiofaba sp. EF100 TaxID=3121274 RepID=UPI0032218268